MEICTWLRKARASGRVVHRELENLQIKWSRWDTLMVNELKINCGHVCLGDGKKQVIKYGKASHWSQWTQKKNPKSFVKGVCVRGSSQLKLSHEESALWWQQWVPKIR